MTVFVYGTLRRGQGNHRLLADAEFIADAYVTHTHPGVRAIMVSLGYFPGVVGVQETELTDIQQLASPVRGELYNVNTQTMRALDRLEGYPDFYNRRVVTATRLDTGGLLNAWMYVLPYEYAHNRTPLLAGDWVQYRNHLNRDQEGVAV